MSSLASPRNCMCVWLCVRALRCWQALEPIWRGASRSGGSLHWAMVHKCAGLSGSWERRQRVWQILCEVWIMPLLHPTVHSPCTPCWRPGGKPVPGACCEGPGWAGRRCRWWPSSPSAWPPTSLPPCPDTCPGSSPSRWSSEASPRMRQPGVAGAEQCLATRVHIDASWWRRTGWFRAQDRKTGRCPACTWKTNKHNWSAASDLLKNLSQY